MIESFYPEENNDGWQDDCRSTGCSCCSVNYNSRRDKQKILEEAKGNIAVVKKICKHYKISFTAFCKSVVEEEK